MSTGGGIGWREGGYLDDDEAGAGTVGGLEVDGALVVADVEALHGGLGDAG